MHLLSGGFTPVAEVRHGKSSCVLDQRGNQHGLVSRQHSLADRNLLAALIFAPTAPVPSWQYGLSGNGFLI